MISVLIVDDEEHTRKCLINSVSWRELGVDTVLQASDGLEAIEIFETNTPNILITDVRMPEMNGIELAKFVHSKYPDCIIAFLSGFADKEYLKAAISLGAVSYIEKPINIEEVHCIIVEALDRLKQIRELQKLKQLNSNYNQELFSIDSIKICTSLSTGIADQQVLRKLKDIWTINDSSLNKYSCFIVKMYNLASIQEEKYEVTKQEFYNYIISKAREYITGGFTASVLSEDRIIFFVKIDKDFDYLANTFAMKLIDDYSEKMRLSFAFGNPVLNIKELYKSYEEAKISLKIVFFKKNINVALYNELSKNIFKFDDKDYDKFEKLIYDGKMEDALFFIDFLTSRVSKCHMTDIGYIKNIYYKIFNITIDIFSSILIKYKDLEQKKDFWSSTKDLINIFELSSYVKALINELFEQLDISNGIDRIVLNIKAYVEANYSDLGLSVKSIARHLGYDYFYICTVYKKMTGNTIGKFITDYRIKCAMKMLTDKKVKLNEVAEKVGYSDQKYFSRVYKQFTGFTPSQYRKDHCL